MTSVLYIYRFITCLGYEHNWIKLEKIYSLYRYLVKIIFSFLKVFFFFHLYVLSLYGFTLTIILLLWTIVKPFFRVCRFCNTCNTNPPDNMFPCRHCKCLICHKAHLDVKIWTCFNICLMFLSVQKTFIFPLSKHLLYLGLKKCSNLVKAPMVLDNQ